MNNIYLVKFEIGYRSATFAFDSGECALSFMDMALDHVTKVDDDDELVISMKRVAVVETNKEEK